MRWLRPAERTSPGAVRADTGATGHMWRHTLIGIKEKLEFSSSVVLPHFKGSTVTGGLMATLLGSTDIEHVCY